MLVCKETSEFRSYFFNTIYGDVTLRIHATVKGPRHTHSSPLVYSDQWGRFVGTTGSRQILISAVVEFEFDSEMIRIADVDHFCFDVHSGKDSPLTFTVNKMGKRYGLILFNEGGEFFPASNELQVKRILAT